MRVPERLRRQEGRHALVDGIPFALPIDSERSPALMAAFLLDADKAAALLPGDELHPVRVFGKGVLLVSVVSYEVTDIGNYIEYSIAIGCTHGEKPAPDTLPVIFQRHYRTGQYVYDLPVSTEISVKGGKGIWGMPKHQASLDFNVTDRLVTSQYDLDGMLVMRVEIPRPRKAWLPLRMPGVNYSQFRGLLMKSYIHFRGKMGFSLLRGRARLHIGDHPRIRPLKALDISPKPIFTAYFADTAGILDDHFEGWFLTYEQPPTDVPEGMESVVGLGLGREWLEPPSARP